MIKLFGIVLIFGSVAFASSASLTSDHICHRQENYTETVNLTTTDEVQVRKNFWCIEKIRCSEFQPEKKEVVHSENVTKSRTIDFCCPDYEEFEADGKKFCKPICPEKCNWGYCKSPGKCECEIGFKGESCDQQCPQNHFGKMCSEYCKCGDLNCHPKTGECLKRGEKIELTTTTTMKANENETSSTTKASVADPFMKNLTDKAVTTTEHNPYSNYSGEYGKEFNHYVKMGVNESNVQESIDKIVEIEYEKASEEYRPEVLDTVDSIIIFDVDNNLEPVRHPQYVTDHHAVHHHEESIAMVTVGCLVLGMLVFLLAMVYIRRITRRLPATRDVDPEMDMQKPQRLEPSKIIHEPLPIPPSLRPSLRKTKSVTFDESIDEVDEMNRGRAKSLPDAYDIPRKQTSMMDIYAQSIKVTPHDIANYSISQNLPGFNTFPRKNVSRKQSLEHIYDEIPPLSVEITNDNRTKGEKSDDLTATNSVYGIHESIERTKL